MGGERIISPNPADITGAQLLVVPTVTQFDGTENLRILSAASVTCVLAIYLRMRRSNGSIEPMQFAHTPNTDRSAKTQDYTVGQGTLLNLVIVPTSGSPVVGECFVQAAIIRGTGTAAIPQGVLAQDYTTVRQPVAWPGMPLRRSTEGRGAMRSVSSHNQTGAGVSTTVPVGARWRLQSVTGQLNTVPSGIAGARQPFFTITDLDGNLRFESLSPNTQNIGVFWNYFLIPNSAGIDHAAAFGFSFVPGMTDLEVRGGEIIAFNAFSLDTLDTCWIHISAEEWLEVAA